MKTRSIRHVRLRGRTLDVRSNGEPAAWFAISAGGKHPDGVEFAINDESPPHVLKQGGRFETTGIPVRVSKIRVRSRRGYAIVNINLRYDE